eukprot:scaffold101884_cov19-Tisochrysis_lutea.AAC.1
MRAGEADAHAHITVGASSGGSALAAAAGRGPVSDRGGSSGGGGAGGGSDLRLTQELVAARVAAEAANRRAEMMEADRDRVRRSLDEAQVCGCKGWQGCVGATIRRPLTIQGGQ